MGVDVYLAVAVLLAPVFAEYAKVRAKAEKAFSMLVVSGLFFLLSLSFGATVFAGFGSLALFGTMLFEVLGWLLLLIGAVWVAVLLLKE
ncbi:MAG TPA: hypothetical protein ENG42_03555 [Candidatus Aenigmarchaeota archaeon]|nr:MAG: hypothetical protein DRP03_01525 [Candidatus Aenigmarchaeota archaeon]HDD46528.1 hypothetical protein [Candidatus Aenigmarchaeota archaeon]